MQDETELMSLNSSVSPLQKKALKKLFFLIYWWIKNEISEHVKKIAFLADASAKGGPRR